MRLPAHLLFWFAASSAFAAPQSLDRGEIAGAKFAIALPAQWNRNVLLIAHGLRAENQPLTAEFSPSDVAYKALFAEGWIVAKTSFRRNGVIIADAIADLDALRSYIAGKYGQPHRVLVEGESLGGLIAILIAEREPREPRLYDGAIAISASLQLREPGSTVGLSLQPKLPLVFVANQSELEAPKAYIFTKLPRDSSAVLPALFRLSRGGQINLNQRERLVALRALASWVERGPSALPRPAGGELFFDATVAPEPQPSAVAMHADGHGFDMRVTGFSPAPGHVLVDAQPADFAAAEIKPFTWFQLTVHDKTYRTFYGRDLDSVKKHQWVIYPHAEGNFLLARNLGDAAATAQLAAGDSISIQRFEPK